MNTSCPPVARSILDVIGRTPLVELTSDNTGTGLAVVCSALGHPFVALISRGNFVERVRRTEAFGAEVIIVEQAVGTCGSFTGVARSLRGLNPTVRTYAVEPAGAAVLGGGCVSNPRHRIQGAGYARTDLDLFDKTLVTGYVAVTDEQAIAAARDLAAEEGIFAGFSTGAHLAAAWRLLAEQEAGATIAFLACDSGLEYLSTDLFP